MLINTFTDFVRAVADYWDKAPADWRAGQVAFNLLVRVRPDLAEMIRGSDFDRSTPDEALPLFYDFIMRHWDDDKA